MGSQRKSCGDSQGSLFNTTSLQTGLNAKSNAGRDYVTNSINVLPRYGLPERGSNNIICESESLVKDLSSTKVLTSKRSNKSNITTVGVELCMNRTLIERGHLVRPDFILNDSTPSVGVQDPILWNHLGDEAAVDDELQLR